MTPLVSLLEPVRHAIAAAMLHFVWQGCALWLITLCVLHALRAATAQVRYAACGALLVLLAVCPVLTFLIVLERPAETPAVRASVKSSLPATALASYADSGPPSIKWTSVTASIGAQIERYESWLVAFWLGGAILFTLRLGFAAIGLAAIKRRRRELPPQLAPLVERMISHLAFRVRPIVSVVDNLPQAVAAGLIKPLVMLPASWISELPPEVLETVIAHELAHLRRWDLAINLLVRVVESVLFFHPAMWWCSRRMRIEREMCCDALAVRIVGNRARYAKGLSFLADRRLATAEPLLVAGIGGPQMVLLERIRQVLDPAVRKQSRFFGASCAAAGALAASIVWLAAVAMVHSPSIETGDATTSREHAVIGAVNSNAGSTGRIAADVRTPPSIEPAPPSEQRKVTLPDYTIEPPDILWIEAARLLPKQPYHVRASDVLTIRIREGHSTDPKKRWSAVVPAGRVELASFPILTIDASGRTEEEAAQIIQKTLAPHLEDPKVSVSVSGYSIGLQPIAGEHLVRPDGKVNLGMYGQVPLAGMTLDEAKKAIDSHLAKVVEQPDVSVSVFAYNSKVYYVIVEGADGDSLARFPITGNETVLDALSQVGGINRMRNKRIFISRPKPGGADTILNVNWKEITAGAATASNYQILPGDRIFVVDESPAREYGVPVPGQDRLFKRVPTAPPQY